MFIKFLKFGLLSAWIIWLSLTAQVFYQPDTTDKYDALAVCVEKIQKISDEVDLDNYPHVFISKSGAGHEVTFFPGWGGKRHKALTSDGSGSFGVNKDPIICTLDSDFDLRGIIGDLESKVGLSSYGPQDISK